MHTGLFFYPKTLSFPCFPLTIVKTERRKIILKEQDFLRDQVKRLKWQEDITYREVAEDLLGMKYNSFINWLHGYTNLGYERRKQLEEYINCMM